DFIESTMAADACEYLARPTSRVTDAQSFEEMRQYILVMYQGVQVSHSLVLRSQYFDCVPFEQQPSVRFLGLESIMSPPSEDLSTFNSLQLNPDQQFDQFGNSLVCENNTIPMNRITLEQLSRFETLRQFLAKGPDGGGRAPIPDSAPPSP